MSRLKDMAKIFELNRQGVKELLRSDEMAKTLESYASKALSTLGDGYESSTYVGKNRVNVAISAATAKAAKDNLENNSILKALN